MRFSCWPMSYQFPTLWKELHLYYTCAKLLKVKVMEMGSHTKVIHSMSYYLLLLPPDSLWSTFASWILNSCIHFHLWIFTLCIEVKWWNKNFSPISLFGFPVFKINFHFIRRWDSLVFEHVCFQQKWVLCIKTLGLLPTLYWWGQAR